MPNLSPTKSRKNIAGLGHALESEVDELRVEAFSNASMSQRAQLGQYPTPPAIARYMAGMFSAKSSSIRVLDPGAGAGSLMTAVVAALCDRKKPPLGITATAVELDPHLAIYATKAMRFCKKACDASNIEYSGTVLIGDFIRTAVEMLEDGLFNDTKRTFNCVILNPPYKKLNTDSKHRHLLRKVGIETSNLYAAFLALSVMMLEPNGELVAITPRSFCNGPYFRRFRQFFLRNMSLRKIHVFESRSEAFADDEVLQENIIFHAVKAPIQAKSITVMASSGPNAEPTVREIDADIVIKPGDPDQFIHIVCGDVGSQVADSMSKLTHSLKDLGLSVSTGRIVDFRSRPCLRRNPEPGSVPLIYPAHFRDGWIQWPRPGHKKPNACLVNERSKAWLVPAAIHVLVMRFSAKEEKRRVVGAVFDPARVPCDQVAFENHLNYYHENGGGLPLALAKGLAAYLNSTIVDTYFRQFSGHTQVNAADLRKLKYPSRLDLEEIGRRIGDQYPNQGELDFLIESEFMGT